ncbi:hypothetical protein [Paraburkholderia adhaesiva]|uniref:hypothetical protein n=1 Tax=Paraburkholderia adhaesiva TaxID=2883244 RepID=UPI001F3E3502|nr:hypothetical protein [Paraburkholderia adhaesiva]
MGSGFATPVVVWVGDDTRQKLQEMAARRDMAVERIGGRLLEQAVRDYTPSGPQVQQQAEVEMGSAPAAGHGGKKKRSSRI